MSGGQFDWGGRLLKQGYLDVNGLIPEVIDRIDYRKGTYRADIGDFSMAGSSFMTTIRDVTPFIALETGDYGWQRAAGGTSLDVGQGKLMGIAQWKAYDGPWSFPKTCSTSRCGRSTCARSVRARWS